MKERGMQPLPPPAIGEELVTLDANMAALMMTQVSAEPKDTVQRRNSKP